MGLFNKLKNILFEDDEVEEIPVYTKKDEVEVSKPQRSQPEVKEEVKREVKKDIKREEPVVSANNEGTRYRSIKRDIDFSYDDVLDEVPGGEEVVAKTPEVEEIELPKEVEKKSPFLSFDEEEFERLNARITRNEARNDRGRENHRVESVDTARRANNNFSATSAPVRENRQPNPDRYKLDNTNVKKPFKPSPVISPVYGILDKNYKKDDIVDKKDGMKREIVKPVVRMEDVVARKAKESYDEVEEVNFDSIRNKAFGKNEEVQVKTVQKVEVKEEVSVDLPETKYVEPVVLDKKYDIEEQEKDLDDIVANHFDEIDEEKYEEVHKIDDYEEDINEGKSHVMDEMERTSTLQILDDIEKELNAIKPISKNEDEEESEREKLERNDTLENDLFNLIDSMYEEGEEEEND